MATLTQSEQRQIDGVIQDLSLRLGLAYPEVDLLEIAKSAGIAVYEVNLNVIRTDLSGVIEYDDDKKKVNPRIYIHDSLSDERKRFTLAHELGHHFLHVGRKLRLDTLDYNEKDTKEETEANYFAASLLVPKNLLTYRMNQGDGISQLAAYFKVSRSVIQNRINWIKVNT